VSDAFVISARDHRGFLDRGYAVFDDVEPPLAAFTDRARIFSFLPYVLLTVAVVGLAFQLGSFLFH
jgi:hypothetical protein